MIGATTASPVTRRLKIAAFAGETVGGNANDLTSIVLDPNVGIHESKAFTCYVRPGRHTKTIRPVPIDTASRPTEESAPGTAPEAQPEGQFK